MEQKNNVPYFYCSTKTAGYVVKENVKKDR